MTDRASAEGLHPECAKRGYHRDGCDVQPPWRDDQGYWLGGMGTPGPRPGPIATLSLYEQGRRQTLMDLGFDIDGIDTATAVEAARDTGPRPDSGIDDWTRVAEAWANVMDGRRIGSGLNAARIGRDTTTGDDWHAIAREYAALASERTEP